MLLILVAIVVAGVVSYGLLMYGSDGYRGSHLAAALAGTFGLFAVLAASVFYVFAGWGWLSSEYKTAIINREYQANYTREEVFYASDVIETIRQLDRKRYEVNGDLIRGKQ